MKEEMSSMATNKVWQLVDLPSEHKAIGTRWVPKVKRKAGGNKARLLAKGYTQREGVDYD